MGDSDAGLGELQRRLVAALDRIGQSAERLSGSGAGAADPAEVEALKQALEDERLANAQLQDRNKSLKDRFEAAADASETALAEQRAAMARLDEDLQRLRTANDQLRESNRKLREANESGVGEPHLINKSMLAELEALRAARAADRSEADAIYAALTPLVANGADMNAGGEA